MKNFYLRILTVCLAMFAVPGMARGRETFADNPARRTAAVQQARLQAQREKEEAARWAADRGVPMRYDDGNRVMELMALRNGLPIYYATRNSNAAISTAAGQVRHTAPFSADGSGVTVGVWDGDAVMTTHPELDGRVAYMDTAPYRSGYHATHVGGTIGATGIVANAKGMVPASRMDSYEWNNDIAEMNARAASYPGETNKIYLSNHSYGTVGGWTRGLNGSPNYCWPSWLTWGDGAVDYRLGQYDVGAIAYDQVVYDAPYYLPFVAAGNDRSDNPANGETVYYLKPQGPVVGKWTAVSYDDTKHPLGDGVYKGGYDNISAEATAKNIMTVGAVNDAVSGGVRAIANATMSSFSSWGPADDGRIKPDIVANGVGLYSCWNNYNNYGNYYTISGTSMATPNACGSAALLVDYFGRRFPGGAMRASTLKGLIIHTADDLGNPGPDYAYGWGLMNTLAAAELIKDYADGNSVRMAESRLSATNAFELFTYHSDGLNPIRATLCWTDPPGPAQTTHDSRTPVLINDLDLSIVGPDGTYYPYRMDYDHPASNATATAENDVDNVEQVYIATPAAGEYTVVVDYDGVLQDGEQHYSLLVSGLSTNAPPVNPDLDGDGLPNGWEMAFFGNPTGAVAAADSDGDGENNLGEYISGHDPTNPASCFAITAFQAPTNGGMPFVVSWESITGRMYGVNWAGNLTNAFTNISGFLPYPADSYTDTVERIGPQHFYRIDVQLAP
jgi:hypothetical protein